MKRVLMVNGIADAFGNCGPRWLAEGHCVQMAERAIRDRVELHRWSELSFEPRVDFSEEEI
jgi:hypothetical protein